MPLLRVYRRRRIPPLGGISGYERPERRSTEQLHRHICSRPGLVILGTSSPSKKNNDYDGTRLEMAATTSKPVLMVRWKEKENDRNLRKLFFAASGDISDQTLSNLAQPFVRVSELSQAQVDR